jgi:hypothetical protein
MNPDQIKTLIEQAKALSEQLAADPTQVGDAQLTEMREQIQAVVKAVKDSATVTPDTVALLKQLSETRTAVIGEQDSRAAELAAVNEEAERLLADMVDPEPVADDKPAESDNGDEGGEPAADVEQPADTVEADREPALAASAAADVKRLTAQVGGLVKVLSQGLTAAAQPAPAEDTKPAGRSAGRIGTTAVPAAPQGDVVTAKVFGGDQANGVPFTDNFGVVKSFHDAFRTRYQDSSYSGRIPVAHVAYEYPESRKLTQDAAANYVKLEALTSPQALVAAGGLCSPLTPSYDVEVIGTSARPIRDEAMVAVQVERGGLMFRPPISAGAAVNGAGLWTLDDDEAASQVNNTGPVKGCYEVDCPGMEQELVEAIYLCLEFSNLTTNFDPETTAANLRAGDIAHARFADNRLFSKMAAQSKALSSPRVIGAVRDILGNLDRATTYLRGKHRIDEALPLTWLAPFWVKALMRADLARQMAAGDWKDALAPTDSLIDSWFTNRGVRPVWHMDGVNGTDEVQTVTVSGSPTGGTFTLTFNGETTAPIAYNATAAQVQSALRALDSIGQNGVTATGGPLPGSAVTVTFDGGVLDGVNVAQMTSSGSFTGGSTPGVAVATTTAGDGAITVSGITIGAQTYDDAAAGGAIPGFPNQIDSLLYPTGSWAFLNGGGLNLGLVRDHILNARNKHRQFQETFEGAAFRGVESLRLVMSVQPTGQTAGTKDLDAITD